MLVKNPEGEWGTEFGLCEAALAQRKAAGCRPSSLTSYAVNGEARYAVAWLREP